MPDSTVTGLNEFLQFLDASPKKMQQGAHVGLLGGAQLIEAHAKANCPVGDPGGTAAEQYGVYPGALRDSIRVVINEKGSTVTAKVLAGGKTPQGADVFYAHLVEFSGAAPHVIKGKDGGPISFNGHVYPQINHPGMQAHPFLRPALDANEIAAIGLVDKQIETALKEG